VGDGWVAAAHLVTLARIAAIPVVLLLLALPHQGAQTGAAAVFFAAALTDALDGPLARRGGDAGRSPLGAVLDLTADKLLVTVVLIDLAARQLAPSWVAMVIVARELVVAGVRSYAGLAGVAVDARTPGKLKMALSSIAVPAAILRLPGAPWLLALTALVTLASAWPYLALGATVLQHATGTDRPSVPRGYWSPAKGHPPRPNRGGGGATGQPPGL
jgi:CDP-diacylglycerol---glycerol-3-phosphate 3-phosphatidyltransferase